MKAFNSIKCLELCDLKKLNKPKNADQWKCDKSITNDNVQPLTKCRITCKDGYDFQKGRSNFKDNPTLCILAEILSEMIMWSFYHTLYHF